MADDSKPTFSEIRDALIPPGTDKEALWAALKGAQRTGGHIPGRPAPDISFGGRGFGDHGGTPGWTPFPPAVGSPPADPFTKGSEASAALAEMFGDMVDAGIPVASVERILGAMLATYGLMTGDDES